MDPLKIEDFPAGYFDRPSATVPVTVKGKRYSVMFVLVGGEVLAEVCVLFIKKHPNRFSRRGMSRFLNDGPTSLQAALAALKTIQEEEKKAAG